MKRILFVVLVLLVASAGGAWWWARQSLPQADGEWRLAGLQAPVEVLADGHGVPHVYARDVEDAWFAAGALHARDRLWQMDLYRRAASGRLSEIFGERTLPIDRRLLTLRLRAAAQAEWRQVGPAARSALTRYAEGVNAVMATRTGRAAPLEFQALRVSPQPWTPEDSLLVGRLMAFRLAENHGAELVRHALARKLNASDALRLTGGYPDDAPTVLDAFATVPAPVPPAPPAAPVSASRTGTAGVAIEAALRPRVDYPAGLTWLDPTAPRGNSNAWAVAPSRTGTGRALLANDPHLQIEMPGVWYELHLVAAGLDVQGATIPGAPFVLTGHNARVAWGVTASQVDVQDLVLERIDVARRRYLTPAGWQPVEVEPVEIPVRGGAAVPFEVWRTRHGAVFADESLDWETPPAWLSPAAPREGEQRALVLQWAGLEAGMADGFEALGRASDWAQFQGSVDRIAALSLNWVYADVDGHVGYLLSGTVPQRSSGDGRVPLAGWLADRGWSGLLQGAALPRGLDPSNGYLASANNRILPATTPWLSQDWLGRWRAGRIVARLREGAPVDLQAAQALQADLRSEAAAQVLAGVPGALAAARTSGADADTVRVLERLAAWDAVVDGRPETALYQLFEDALWKRTFTDELEPALFARFYEWAGHERVAGLYAIVDDPRARWWEDIGTVDRREARDDVYLLAAGDARRALLGEHGGDTATWATVHGATFAHPLGDGARPLAWLFSRGPLPMTGDGTTVMRVSHRRLHGFGAFEIPSLRQVLDVGAWDSSAVILPTGQSGHPLSSNYFDQNGMWRAGDYRTVHYSRLAVEAARAHRLVLTP